MLSPSKLIALILIIWCVWMLFRWSDHRKKQAANRSQAQNQQAHTSRQNNTEQPHDSSVEMRECTQCGAFVSAQGCDKQNCPVRS